MCARLKEAVIFTKDSSLEIVDEESLLILST
jgi:hypothetical protein